MTLRLDPALPLVWRTPDDLQVGAAAPIAVFEGAGDVETGLIAALRHGVHLSTLLTIGSGLGASPERVHEVVDRLAAGFVGDDDDRAGARASATSRAEHGRADAAARRPRTVAVDGTGPLPDLIAANLSALGHAVIRLQPLAPGEAAHPADLPGPDVVVIVAAWAVTPARHLPWLRRDLPHLAVVGDDAGVRVGPFVEPGRGPCLRCLDLAARDADAAWPVIAAQLAGRPAPVEPARLRFDAAALAAAAVDDRFDDHVDAGLDAALGAVLEAGFGVGFGGSAGTRAGHRLAAASVSFDRRGSSGRRREHAEHPECGCRAPAGIAIPLALPAADRRDGPSSATAVAWRA